ncbi:hypothetical protein [Rhodococcus sp. IEGM 1408]|uniref:hypothetical protein n=1 Tax=Rhodococcus sp. IEGM 1408 TaxID=3082220 RepID=UPI0029539C94|nr:hypothetical protein [Rhodococcus sp. IEGM 1408]MDV8002503.1 hypothetical protein [Rhodococcus sp. IEGM 1408]
MRIPPSASSRRPGRRILAASAALGLALSVTACTIGEVDDDESTTAQSAAPAGTAPEQAQEPAPEGPDTPDAPVDQLVLNDQDAPELGLVAVSTEELSGGISSLEGLTAGMRVDPAACADFNQDAFLSQAEPGVMAIQAGQVADTQVAVAATTLTSGIPDRDRLLGECPTMSVTIPIQGTEVKSETVNTLLPMDAPEGVEGFTAVTQDNSMDMMGQEILTGTVMITGVVRGIGVSVTATSGNGPVTDEARGIAMETFVKQAEKVRTA